MPSAEAVDPLHTTALMKHGLGGGRWEHNGMVVSEAIDLDRSTVYVLSHSDEVPCRIVMEASSPAGR
ncbi:hypothetical protein GCM10009681_18610 [Luedemannella helvata]|uniref:Uncharacterized protein n=1 Tax=Luedemannella helvata TaxID=349315 RepID=A0ABP4W837_9ACTN